MADFPTSVFTLDDFTDQEYLDEAHGDFGHVEAHNALVDEIAAAQTKIGTGASTPVANRVLRGTGTGTTAYGQVQNADIATGAVTEFSIADGAITARKLAAQPRARAYHNANQSIPNNAFTAVALNSERWDNDTIHDTATNNSRLTCKTAGLYFIDGGVLFAGNATGERGALIRLNGAITIKSVMVPTTSAGIGAQLSVSTEYELAVNDYVELVVFQNSGGALNLLAQGNYSPEFAMARIG